MKKFPHILDFAGDIILTQGQKFLLKPFRITNDPLNLNGGIIRWLTIRMATETILL